MVMNFRGLANTVEILLKIQDLKSESQPDEDPGCGFGGRVMVWERQPAGGGACPGFRLSVRSHQVPASLL